MKSRMKRTTAHSKGGSLGVTCFRPSSAPEGSGRGGGSSQQLGSAQNCVCSCPECRPHAGLSLHLPFHQPLLPQLGLGSRLVRLPRHKDTAARRPWLSSHLYPVLVPPTHCTRRTFPKRKSYCGPRLLRSLLWLPITSP